jgi:hypothetical protein
VDNDIAGGQNVADNVRQIPKKKLQIVLVKANKSDKYKKKFRQPYSRDEERAVVDFLMENGGFSLVKGSRVWRHMEEAGICPGRSGQALQQQFLKHILKRLDEFGVTEAQLREADDRQEQVSAYLTDNESAGESPSLRGFRTEASYYTAVDDTKLLMFIVDNGRYEDVGGVALWQLIVERKLLPGRSWQSIKERQCSH